MAKSTYLKNAILNHMLGKSTFTPPANYYLALYEGNPTTGGGEVSGGSYARQSITWGTVADGAVDSQAAINFTNMPVTTVQYWAIVDAAVAGNVCWYGSMAIPVTTTAGQAVPISPGDLTLIEG